MHKTPVGFRFIVASKDSSTKPIANTISNTFKLLFNTINKFHKKSLFYAHTNFFWVVQNSFPVIDKLNKINSKQNAKSISTFDFSTLYTKIPHNLLLEVLFELIDFVFKGNNKKKLGFTSTTVYWTNKGIGKRYFTKNTLKDTVQYLITKCFFTVGNIVMLQIIGIPMGIDPAPFWANLFLYFYENKFIKNLLTTDIIRTYRYHSIFRFIDDLCSLNDGNDFKNSHADIYPKELELKPEHEGTHATFLDLDIAISNGRFIYKLYDKRDHFNFKIVRMPYLSSNIPHSVFYGSILSEFLRIARCTLLLQDFIPTAKNLFKRMLNQGGVFNQICRQIHKAIDKHPQAFSSFGTNSDNILKELMDN